MERRPWVLPPWLLMGALFVGTILLALLVAPTYDAQGVYAFPVEERESLGTPFLYLGLILVFTAVILIFSRLKLRRLIQGIILVAVFSTLLITTSPLFRVLLFPLAPPWIPDLLSFLVGGGLAVLLYFFPEWWVVDLVGLFVAAGVAAILGISFGLLPALVLLVAFAIYDFFAVYGTRHMLDLADTIVDLHLPVMFVVPKEPGYSLLREKGSTFSEGKGKSDAMFMGLGDAIFPAVLAVSSEAFFRSRTPLVEGALLLPAHAIVAYSTLLGATAGFVILMGLVLRGKPQAGLPLLNGGAIAGFLLSSLVLYGVSPLWEPIRNLLS